MPCAAFPGGFPEGAFPRVLSRGCFSAGAFPRVLFRGRRVLFWCSQKSTLPWVLFGCFLGAFRVRVLFGCFLGAFLGCFFYLDALCEKRFCLLSMTGGKSFGAAFLEMTVKKVAAMSMGRPCVASTVATRGRSSHSMCSARTVSGWDTRTWPLRRVRSDQGLGQIRRSAAQCEGILRRDQESPQQRCLVGRRGFERCA